VTAQKPLKRNGGGRGFGGGGETEQRRQNGGKGWALPFKRGFFSRVYQFIKAAVTNHFSIKCASHPVLTKVN
jgi:hypothetical protein